MVHAPSNRDKKGTRFVIEACERLPVDLEIVEGVPHHEARERYANADIVVDQLNAGWHGVFAIEAMALGKPVVAYLDPAAVERSAEAFGVRVPIVPSTKETLAEALRTARRERSSCGAEIGAEGRYYVEQVHDIDRIAGRLLRDLPRGLAGAAPPARAPARAASRVAGTPARPRARDGAAAAVGATPTAVRPGSDEPRRPSSGG